MEVKFYYLRGLELIQNNHHLRGAHGAGVQPVVDPPVDTQIHPVGASPVPLSPLVVVQVKSLWFNPSACSLALPISDSQMVSEMQMFPLIQKFLSLLALWQACSFKSSHDSQCPSQLVTDVTMGTCSTTCPEVASTCELKMVLVEVPEPVGGRAPVGLQKDRSASGRGGRAQANVVVQPQSGSMIKSD